MRLIGMLDSPYVRRVAVSLQFFELPFTHEPLSVFGDFSTFAKANPIVKAPTLVTDGGVVLMDSTTILEHLERLVPRDRSLVPLGIAEHVRSSRIVGLALAACEKTVQIVYERNLRPAEKQHEPWLDRIQGQLLAAYAELERECAGSSGWLLASRPLQADITTAVAWNFSQNMLGELLSDRDHAALSRLSRQAEARPEFLRTPAE